MEQYRTHIELAEREPLAHDPRAAPVDREPGEEHLYHRAMNQHPVLGPAGEQALAIEIEARSRALWIALLSHPTMGRYVARRAAAALPAARAVLQAVERATSAAATRSRRLERAVRTASEQLHTIDVDHVVADELVALIAAAARDPADVPSQPPLDIQIGTKALARYAKKVSDAARAVVDARSRFVHANIGLVFHVARRYRSSSLSFADFVQEGMFGLIKAVDRFDYRRGYRFSTYATWWIRHAMGRALADKSRLVRIPVHLQEMRQRLVGFDRTLRRELAREPTREELADAAGISHEKIEWIQQAHVAREIRLDEPIGDDEGRPRAESFVDPSDPGTDPDESLHRQSLASAARRHMHALTAQERDILRRRFALEGIEREATLREIAKDYGLTRERIRQIQANALRKLRVQLDCESAGDEHAP